MHAWGAVDFRIYLAPKIMVTWYQPRATIFAFSLETTWYPSFHTISFPEISKYIMIGRRRWWWWGWWWFWLWWYNDNNNDVNNKTTTTTRRQWGQQQKVQNINLYFKCCWHFYIFKQLNLFYCYSFFKEKTGVRFFTPSTDIQLISVNCSLWTVDCQLLNVQNCTK